ncbi:hypothetical protein [Sorangium sp. So ce131]|uniref:hypothetical protein n=1 Tax=Sorangium sp. So ce131 TaxID=3133282 RepID=UPI003F63B581
MMENGMGRGCSALACVVGLLASPPAWAQDPAPAPADPGTAAAPAEGSAPPVEPTATATAGDAAAPTPAPGTTEPVAEPPAPESQIPSWFRLDADGAGFAAWAGATHKVGPVDLASDIFLTTSGFAEFDIGPAFTLGPVILNPMVGVGFNFINREPAALIAPQLYTFIDVKPVYFESWLSTSFSSIFTEGAQDYFYTRDFLLVYPIDDFGIGPHFELTYGLNESAGDEAAGVLPSVADVLSLQVGGVVGLNYGTGNKLLLYLGYETQAEGNKLAGRFTFIHNF